VWISAEAAKEKSAPEEVAPKAAGIGTEAVKNDSPSKPKALAKGERKSPLSQPNKDKAMAEAKPNGRKAPVRKQVNGKGKKKNGNKQQRRRQTVRTKPTTTERADVPAKSDPKVKGKKKQQTTTTTPVYEDEEPEEVQYPDEKVDVQSDDYETTEEPERRAQRPRKRVRRPPPPRVIVVVAAPRPNYPTRKPTPSTTYYYGTTNDWEEQIKYMQTTLPPGYGYTGDYQSESGTNYPWKTANTNYPYYQPSYIPNYQTSYNPYHSTVDNGYYQQFFTTYYPKYDWTKFYGNSSKTPDNNNYYRTMPPWNNEASTEYNKTQYYYNLAYGSTAMLPEYFPNYNWTSIYGSSGMPYNGANWSSAPAQNSSQPSMLKNSTDTTPESSTMDSWYRLRSVFGVVLKNSTDTTTESSTMDSMYRLRNMFGVTS
jgi:hypothetical protein